MRQPTREPGRGLRAERVEHTRARILVAAERLFAEHGVFNVSNRQISEAAGQGNNTAVSYHFGSKNDLVRAIIARHAVPVEEIRRQLHDRYADSATLRDWVTCTVRPITDHLAALGSPSWYARFAAQLMTEPALRQLAAAEFEGVEMLHRVTARLHDCLPDLPPRVRLERDDMARTLIVHFCAERERTADPAWQSIAGGLINAIEGLYRAPNL
ncbi:TetR/AcrR family transcriptional regulator [Actinoplanes hulinensis]|uniref:TetR/AcrR family transcriptional regulator n=1 Tax=Actinoplanes hulinensis TaxID=1144547 RepID=A0ABS7B824_9ACTN|nr:TetR/AcrR family transcriptional regulator [Actinoplanes hulinensis]MBW6437145.1 TetR/AcrR family transcriptional regulator [Actinoplanes hulinensis]